MSRVKNNQFWESAKYNNRSFMLYYQRLLELSISMFKWDNLPDTVDERFMELALFGDGMCVFFKDKELDDYVALRCMIGGKLDVYNIPTIRNAYAANGYNQPLDQNDSVIIFNNMIHTNSVMMVEYYAKRLWDIDRTIDINIKAQKTPILIRCNETERLTMKNLYKNYTGNEPCIQGTKGLNADNFTVLKTDAPFVADRVMSIRNNIWNEALTYLGISNTSFNKRERLLSTEAGNLNGDTVASRYSRLNARRQACEQINKMFGLDIWCDYRKDYQVPELPTVEEMEDETVHIEVGEDVG